MVEKIQSVHATYILKNENCRAVTVNNRQQQPQAEISGDVFRRMAGMEETDT